MLNSVILLCSTNTIYIMMTFFIVAVLYLANEIDMKRLSKLITVKYTKSEVKVKNIENLGKKLPGPAKRLIVGNLDLLDENPFPIFSALKKTYGNVFGLQLGYVPAVVVNGYENLKEVMLTKGDKFDARPNFNRFNALFDGDKENSLAFCNWSDLQKARRDMLTPHTFPRKFSFNFNRFNDVSMTHMQSLESNLRAEVDQELMIKPLISDMCFRVFLEYFASQTYTKDEEGFKIAAKSFDEIFWEVNQGRACDFLPFLEPFYMSKLSAMRKMSENIRHFMEQSVVGERFNNWQAGDDVKDYIDSMIDEVKVKQTMDLNKALFAIEDIIGGHSAVANFVVKTLALLVKNQEAQKQIQKEIDNNLSDKMKNDISLNDRSDMIYTEAAILESLRLISSPIVPHVASADSTIAGYEVKEGTFIFLNNYELNTSPELWDEPEKFSAERFISKEGRIAKPEFFVPFGFGRRSCMGYKLVHMLAFLLITNILKDFDILPRDENEIKVSQCTLAVRDETHIFKLKPRVQITCSSSN